MFNSFRRLLRRSKSREIPPEENDAALANKSDRSNMESGLDEAHGASLLPRRPRPTLTAQVDHLQCQHRELQRRFRQLQNGKSSLRKDKLSADVKRIASGARSSGKSGLASHNPRSQSRMLASRSTSRATTSSASSTSPKRKTSPGKQSAPRRSSFVADVDSGSWASAGLPEEGAANLRQAANANRNRRLRAWSQTHQQDGGTREHSDAQSKVDTTLTMVADSSTGSGPLQDKAWAIMATLHLESLDKKRGVQIPREVEAKSPKIGLNGVGDGGENLDVAARRRTELSKITEQVASKPAR